MEYKILVSKEEFEQIKSGKLKQIFCLNEQDKHSIHLLDTLLLVNEKDSSETMPFAISMIEVYKSLESAVFNTYGNSLKSFYSEKEEALKHYLSKEEFDKRKVKQLGVVVFYLNPYQNRETLLTNLQEYKETVIEIAMQSEKSKLLQL